MTQHPASTVPHRTRRSSTRSSTRPFTHPRSAITRLALALCLGLGAHMATAQTGSANEQAQLMQQVKTELQGGQNSQALQTAQQWVRTAPGDYRGHYYMGLALMGLQRYDEAKAAAQRSLQATPAASRGAVQSLQAEIQKRSQGGNLIAQAEEAYQEGLSAKAAGLFERAYQSTPQQPELGIRAATLYLDSLNQPVDAGRVLWQVALAHPNHAMGKSALERLAPIQATLDAQAQEWLKQARQQEPAQALQTLANAQAIAPKLPGLLQARAAIASRGTDRAQLQAAIKELARTKQASADQLGALPEIERWLQDPAFNQFLNDLLGSNLAGQVKQWADPVQRQQQLQLMVGQMVLIPATSGIASFYIGQTEVTQGQWQAVMGNNPSFYKQCGQDCPVEEVSWNDAQEFIQKLNAKTGQTYRLPTEKEWEYACTAGRSTTYCGGNDVDAVAWYDGNSGNKTHAVRGKQANAFGLYDMSGNVWEWVNDCYDGDCGRRVLRGGAWSRSATGSRADYRNWLGTSNRSINYGFRLARIAP